MGNSQSALEDRNNGRGSKPRGLPAGKNSSGTSPASKYDTPSPLSTGVPYSQYSDSEVEFDQEFRKHIRSQLLSSGDHNVTRETDGEKVEVLALSLARSLSRPGSRRTNEPPPRASPSKGQSNTSQLSLSSERTVDLETAVALLQELRKTATPEDLVALRKLSSVF